jgi:hypothetical protein
MDDGNMQSSRGKDHATPESHPSWLMAKFWMAAVVGAILYGVEKSVDWCRRRVRGEGNSKGD